MADISKITTLDGTTYNVKDSTARSSIPSAATATPLMDGTGTVGTSTKYAREDHKHPSDTAKLSRSDELLTTNPFAPNSLRGPYISKIDNAFYAADKRWNVTMTNIGTDSVSNLFNGNYDNKVNIQNGNTSVLTIDFSTESNGYMPGYPYGYILVSFYYAAVPASVSGRVYCNYSSHGIGWHDIAFTPVSDSGTNSVVYRSEHQGYYQISKIEITIVGDTSNSYGHTEVCQVEMHLDRPDSQKNPFLSKYGEETLYYPLTAPSFVGPLTGNASTATSAGSATKATQDESGNNIKATYASSFSISDHTITLKNKNGSSLGTVTVPDTTYSAVTSNDIETATSTTDSVISPENLKNVSGRWGNYILSSAVKAKAFIAANRIIVGDSSGYKAIAADVTFDLKYPILYSLYSNTNSGSNVANPCTQTSYAPISYDSSIWTTGTLGQMIYLVGTINSSGNFVIDSTPLTQTVPSSVNNKYYIPLGLCAGDSGAGMVFTPAKELWTYQNGAFRNVTVDNNQVIIVDVASFSALPQTVSDSRVTANHVVISSILSDPSAQRGSWTVSTSSGSLTIDVTMSGTTPLGSITGSTTMRLILAIPDSTIDPSA